MEGIETAETSVCNSGTNCCKPEELVCHGDPDGQMVCACYKSWDCDDYLRPEKCSQHPMDTPDGKGGWSCSASGALEKCIRDGSDLPSGVNGWKCKAVGGKVECSRPTNTPDGGTSWDCSYAGEFKVCKKKDDVPVEDGGLPASDGYVPPPKDTGVPPKKDQGVTPKPDTGFTPPPGWTCSNGPNGELICKKAGGGVPENGSGGPQGKGSFKCYWKNNMITCEGSSGTPPGGNGWNCVVHEDVGGWRCKKSVGPNDTPNGGTWSCTSGTSYNGIVCVQYPPPPKPGAECQPGAKMWCDGQSYCGWGQVTCGSDGKWKRKFSLQTFSFELDCWELADGRRPNTVCACYFTFFNKDCCETADCVLPPGTNGQICPASPGWYCDYCNPLNPKCNEGGAKCVTTNSYETYCGKDCSGGKACPAGSKCSSFNQGSGTTWQCTPNDGSCYY